MRKRISTLSLLASVAAFAPVSGNAQQPIGQWDFNNGNLAATTGPALEYADAATQSGTAFGTTASFSVPDIGGAAASVMRFPKATSGNMGYRMTVDSGPIGGEYVNTYTLIMDVLFPADSSSKWRGLLQVEDVINADADLFINNNNGIGIGGNYSGTVSPNTWHRLAFVFDQEVNQIRKYIDGNLVGTQNYGGIDDRFALNPGGVAFLFTDNDGESELGYVNSIQLWNIALSTPQVRAIGAPSAAGLPATIPPIPSGIERFIPAGPFASRNATVGAVITPGSTTIQDSSISVSLNGTAVANPTITRADDLITVRSAAQNLTPGNVYTNVVTFTDSLVGVRRFTNVFTAAIFFEDFDSVELGPNVDEGLAGEKVWTKVPPLGWSVNNTNMAGFNSPDDDGDGHPDGDGVTEWFGWTFADKNWWIQAAGDQRRSEFTLSTGVAAIADPDEWDDRAHDQGLFNSIMTSPEISLAGVSAGTAFLRFHSSWRPEARDDGAPNWPVDGNGQPINNQTAIVTVSYDGGTPIQIMKWDSVGGSPTYHDHNPNETVTIQLNNPANAQRMKLEFHLVEAANDWWWAVDNIVVAAGATAPSITAQPAAGWVSAGSAVTLSVTASGTAPLNYQWRRNGTDIAGATGATYTIPSVTEAEAGNYTVVVSNAGGSATSAAAGLFVFSGAITNNLVAHLKFDQNLTDSSGRGNHGEPVGGPTFEAGRVGGAVKIPSGQDYVTLNAPADLNFGTTTDFSFSFWARVNGLNGDPSLIGNKDWNSGGNQGWVVFTAGNRRAAWNIAGPGGARRDSGNVVQNVFPDDTWAHIAMTFDRDATAVIYVNGERRNVTEILNNPINVDTPEGFAVNIGQDGTGNYGSAFSDLLMDDVGVWRRVLTAQEVASIYAKGLAGEDLSKASGEVVVLPPTITANPATQLVSAGADVSLTVGVGGTAPFTYVWQRNGENVAGGTGAALNLNAITTAQAGDYRVIVSNSRGSATSAVARVSVSTAALGGSLVTHLKFNGDYADTSGRGNDAAASGNPTFEAGKLGQALRVVTVKDGSRFAYATLGVKPDLQFGADTDFSVSFWVNITASEGDPSFIANKDWNSSSNPGWGIFGQGGGNIRVNLTGTPGSSANRFSETPGPNIRDGNWHHVLVSFWRGVVASTYVDGQRVNVAPLTTTGTVDTGLPLNIGQDGRGTYTDGGGVGINALMDDVAIWHRALTGQEAASIYAAGQSGGDLSTLLGSGGDVSITGVSRSGNNIIITVGGGANVRLQKKSSLSDANWTTLNDTPVNGVFTVPADGAAGFFRAVVQ